MKPTTVTALFARTFPLTLPMVSAVALAVSAAPVAAQQTKLRVADSFPAGHYVVEYGTKPWMDEIKRLTNGKVDFEYYPAEQLGKAKDLLSLTQNGVADIGYVAPAFVTDKLPLSTVAELPEAFSSSCAGTNAYWQLVKPGGILDKREIGPAGMRVLWTMVLPPYQLYMGKTGIEGVDVVKGKKIRTTGAAKELAIRKMGAVPVQIPTPDVMEALSRGTVDGMLFPHSSVLSYDLQNTVKSATVGENLGSFVITYMISKRKWDQLPADVRDAMDKAAETINHNACQKTDHDEANDIERLKKAGVTMVHLPEAESAKLKDMLSSVSKEWAANLDKRRLPGSEVLAAFQQALKDGK